MAEFVFFLGATSLHIGRLFSALQYGVGKRYSTVKDASPGPNYRPHQGGGTSF